MKNKKINKNKTIWNMRFTEKMYNEVIEETKEILKSFNQEHLINWEEPLK